MLECVINVSEGRRPSVIEALARAAGSALLDVHTDAHHNRSVLTLVGELAPRAVARVAVERIDVRAHVGVHPRIGAVDVVPFVPLGSSTMDDAIGARDRFATWASGELGLPCFLYGTGRSLPELRRTVRTRFVPDSGPQRRHATAGATAVGARAVLVAYNLVLAAPDLEFAQQLARELRSPEVRTLAFAIGDEVQLSANLVAPLAFGPAALYDAVAAHTTVARAELVGLLPRSVLDQIPPGRWPALDLADDVTIDARLAALGLSVDDDLDSDV